MLRYALLMLFVISGCATKMSHLGTEAQKKSDFQELRYQKECDEGIGASCFKYIRYSYMNSGHEKTKLMTETRCKNKENYFCYGHGLVEFLAGNITLSKKIMQSYCDQNIAESCYFLGYLQYQKDAAQKNARPNDYLAKSCELGDLSGCVFQYALKDKISDKSGKKFKSLEKKILSEKNPNFDNLSYLAQIYNQETPKQAAEQFRKYCHLGNKNSCYYLQFLELSPNDAFNKKNVIMKKECKNDSSWACQHLCQEEYASNNIDAAYLSCSKSCFMGEASGCASLAKISDRKNNIADAEFFSKMGCALGSDNSCHGHAYYLERQKKTDEALPPLKIICESGNVSGCLRLSFLYGQKKQMDESAKYALMGCDMGNGDSCYSYGVKLHQEKNVQSTEYFKKSCDFNSNNGCMGMCLAEAEKGDLMKSRSYLIKICETSTSEMCSKYHDKRPEELDISLKDLKNTCHYDPDKPWWQWAVIVGAGVATGQVIR